MAPERDPPILQAILVELAKELLETIVLTLQNLILAELTKKAKKNELQLILPELERLQNETRKSVKEE